MNNKPIKLALCLLMFTDVVAAANTEEFWSMSLEQLLELKVTTVSKQQELSSDAPGIITVISKEEIKAYGARHIKDILQRAPNLFVFDSSTFTATGVTLRGGATQHLNNRVLYLLNGRPLRESQNGGYHTDINLLLPVSMLERIEVIRGPGSVLYGSNAFNGTINFITKDVNEEFSATVEVEKGPNNYREAVVTLQSKLTENGKFTLIVNDMNTDGQALTARDEAGNLGSRYQSQKGRSIYMDLSYLGLDFSFLDTKMNLPIFTGPFLWQQDTSLENKRLFYDIGYQSKFNENWSASMNYSKNILDKDISPTETSAASSFLSSGIFYEMMLNGKINEQLRLLSGVAIDQLKGDLKNRGGKYTSKRKLFYNQLDYQWNKSTKLTLGFQWNKAENINAEVSPRFALVKNIDSNLTAKFLYGKAFRSPYGSELFFQSPFLLGDTELSPEIVATSEFELVYKEENIRLSSVYFHSNTEDSIGRAIVNGVNTFVNENNKISSKGVELELDCNLNNVLKLQSSYIFQEGEDSKTGESVMMAPNKMFKLGLIYKNSENLQIGIWNSYFGSVSQLEDLTNNHVAVVNPSAKSINLLSLNLTFNISNYYNLEGFKNMEFALFANNLLDEEVHFPELSRKRVNTYPQSHERGVHATISMSF